MNKTLSHKIRRIRCNPLFPCNIKKPQLLRVYFIHLFLGMRSAVPYSCVGYALPNTRTTSITKMPVSGFSVALSTEVSEALERSYFPHSASH